MAVCLCVGGSAVVAFLGQSDVNIMDQGIVVNGTINTTGFDWNGTNALLADHVFGPPLAYDQVGKNSSGNHSHHPSKYGVASIVTIPTKNASTKNSSVTWCTASCNALASCDAITVHMANASCARYTCTTPCSVLNVTTPVATDFSELVRATASENTAGGYAWCLGSVLLYAAYEVVYKKCVVKQNKQPCVRRNFTNGMLVWGRRQNSPKPSFIALCCPVLPLSSFLFFGSNVRGIYRASMALRTLSHQPQVRDRRQRPSPHCQQPTVPWLDRSNDVGAGVAPLLYLERCWVGNQRNARRSMAVGVHCDHRCLRHFVQPVLAPDHRADLATFHLGRYDFGDSNINAG